MQLNVVVSVWDVCWLWFATRLLWLLDAWGLPCVPVMQVLRQSLVARPSAVARSASDTMLYVLRTLEMFQKGYLIWSWLRIGVIAVGCRPWKKGVGPWSFWHFLIVVLACVIVFALLRGFAGDLGACKLCHWWW